MHQKKENDLAGKELDLLQLDIETLIEKCSPQLIELLISNATNDYCINNIIPKLKVWRNKKTGNNFLQQVLTQSITNINAFDIGGKQEIVTIFDNKIFPHLVSILKKYDCKLLHHTNKNGQTALDLLVEGIFNDAYAEKDISEISDRNSMFLSLADYLEGKFIAIEELILQGFYCETVVKNDKVTSFFNILLLIRESICHRQNVIPYFSTLTFNSLFASNLIEYQLCVGMNILHSTLKLRPNFEHADALFMIMKECLCYMDNNTIKYDPLLDKFVIEKFIIAPEILNNIRILVENREFLLCNTMQWKHENFKIKTEKNCFQVLDPLFHNAGNRMPLREAVIGEILTSVFETNQMNSSERAAYNYLSYNFLNSYLNYTSEGCVSKKGSSYVLQKSINEESIKFRILFFLMDEKYNLLFQKLIGNSICQRIKREFNNRDPIYFTWMHYAIKTNNFTLLKLAYDSKISPNIPTERPAIRYIKPDVTGEIQEFAKSHCFWSTNALYNVQKFSTLLSVCATLFATLKLLDDNCYEFSLNPYNSPLSMAFCTTLIVASTIVAFKPYIVPDTIAYITNKVEQATNSRYYSQSICNIL